MTTGLKRWEGKVALVTGASAGIGAAIAERLVDEGLLVVGVARRVEKLHDLGAKLRAKKGKFYPLEADVSKESDILEAFQWMESNLGHVHVLVNNAGVCRPTSLIDGDTSEWRKTLDTNLLGLSVCTREAVRVMRKHSIDGHVVNINSIMGHYVPNITGFNMYAPSKYGVTALTECLRQELNEVRSRIKVSSVSPGAVGTEFFVVNELVGVQERAKAENMPFLRSEDVADAVVYVLSTPPNVLINELMIKPVGEMY